MYRCEKDVHEELVWNGVPRPLANEIKNKFYFYFCGDCFQKQLSLRACIELRNGNLLLYTSDNVLILLNGKVELHRETFQNVHIRNMMELPDGKIMMWYMSHIVSLLFVSIFSPEIKLLDTFTIHDFVHDLQLYKGVPIYYNHISTVKEIVDRNCVVVVFNGIGTIHEMRCVGNKIFLRNDITWMLHDGDLTTPDSYTSHSPLLIHTHFIAVSYKYTFTQQNVFRHSTLQLEIFNHATNEFDLLMRFHPNDEDMLTKEENALIVLPDGNVCIQIRFRGIFLCDTNTQRLRYVMKRYNLYKNAFENIVSIQKSGVFLCF